MIGSYPWFCQTAAQRESVGSIVGRPPAYSGPRGGAQNAATSANLYWSLSTLVGAHPSSVEPPSSEKPDARG